MAKVEVFCRIRRKPIIIEKKLADALVKMKRAEYQHPPVVEEKPEAKELSREEIKEKLLAQSIEFDGRASTGKLLALLKSGI